MANPYDTPTNEPRYDDQRLNDARIDETRIDATRVETDRIDDGGPDETSKKGQAKQADGYAAEQARGVADNAAGQAKKVAGNAGDRAKDVAGTARDEAVDVKDTAVAAGSDVVDHAKQEAGQVIDEAKEHGRALYDQGVAELQSHARDGQAKLASVVRSLTDELGEMVRGSSQNGPVTQFASGLLDQGERASSWLESTDGDGLVRDIRRFAARKPFAFLAAAAGVGILGARLARGLQGASSDEKELTSGYRRTDRRSYDTRGSLDAHVPAGYGAAETASPAGYVDPSAPGYDRGVTPGVAGVQDDYVTAPLNGTDDRFAGTQGLGGDRLDQANVDDFREDRR
ncbi:hypothetical protein [Nigerium massiliense]|uniref:hypothetical protein n=1 Tax=Nigerium massiliense TaxID=1522317 RepID=UPI00058D6F91|nr:hypothetical protein [Nigerium massiliense]